MLPLKGYEIKNIRYNERTGEIHAHLTHNGELIISATMDYIQARLKEYAQYNTNITM